MCRRLWFVLVSVLIFSAVPARAGFGPQAPFARLGDGGTSLALAVDAAGRTHVAWTPATVGSAAQVQETTVVDGQIGPVHAVPVTMAKDPVMFSRKLALIADGDMLHIAAVTDTRDVCYLRRPLSGGPWSSPDCIASNADETTIVALADGTLAIAWSGTQVGVALRRADSAWQPLPTPAVTDQDFPAYHPRLAIAGNTLVILWIQRRSDGPGNSVRTELLGRELQSGNWGPVVSISGFSEEENQWLVSDAAAQGEGDGTLHLAYVLFAPGADYSGPKYTLFYRRGRLDRLEPMQRISDGVHTPSVSVRQGIVDLAWTGDVGGLVDGLRVQNPEIMWTRWRSGWTAPMNISATAGLSHSPVIGILPDGRGIAAWDDGTDVLLKQSSSNATWATAPMPTVQTVWPFVERADRPVNSEGVARSWLWGPYAWEQSFEPYAEAPGSERTVIYFDKARIEITDPNRSPDDPAYLTTGLLVTELASGRQQYGDQLFIGREPAAVPVAGDTASSLGPTYASFRSLVYIPDIGQRAQSPDRTGQRVAETVDRAGRVTSGAPAVSTSYARFVPETGHNIAAPFWSFLNQRGKVYVEGRLQEDLVFPWVTTMGYPITEPYWIRTVVAGVERDVLVQLYQRRVLTYTPSNPAGFEVEMGNVGQHYYLWRHGATPWTRR